MLEASHCFHVGSSFAFLRVLDSPWLLQDGFQSLSSDLLRLLLDLKQLLGVVLTGTPL